MKMQESEVSELLYVSINELKSMLTKPNNELTFAKHYYTPIILDKIEELMQPFVRGNEARTIQGSGLGLSIVKRIVDIHQGELTIRNREHGGLEAIISLPINPVEKIDMPTISRFEKLKQSITEHF